MTQPDSDLHFFIQTCDRLREKTTNCSNSRSAFATVTSIPEAVNAFRQFWVSVVTQVPDDFIQTVDILYPRYRSEINAAGVYFNESPGDRLNALVFIGGHTYIPEVSIPTGRSRVIVVGRSKVSIGDHIRCRCYSDEAEISCTGHAQLTIDRGKAIATERSHVTGSGEIHTSGNATVRIYGGHLYDGGHLDIQAYNDATVHSFTDRHIILHDRATLIKQQPTL